MENLDYDNLININREKFEQLHKDDDKLINDGKYKILTSKKIALINSIKKIIGKDNLYLLDGLDETENELTSIEINFYYEQGKMNSKSK